MSCGCGKERGPRALLCDAEERIAELEAEVVRLRAALEWYADSVNYKPVLYHKRAQAALETT